MGKAQEFGKEKQDEILDKLESTGLAGLRSLRRVPSRPLLPAMLFVLILAIILPHQMVLADATPPQIISMSPVGYTREYPVLFEAESNEPALCRYSAAEEEYDLMENSLQGNGTLHNDTLFLDDGTYSYFLACRDYENNTGAAQEISFILDTSPPEVEQHSPSDTVYDSRTSISLQTDEDCNCRYSLSDIPYDDMENSFSTTGKDDHESVLKGLVESAYDYYVLCRDKAGNTMQDSYQISFDVNLRPSATVIIDGGSVLKDGTYHVRVVASEELEEPPLLKYNYNDNTNFRVVSLTGSGTTFSGYMIVADDNKNHVGTFEYSGMDLSGLSGTEITSGKLFLVDTEEPESPLSLNIENYKNGIKLSWYYEGEDADYFRIFKSDTSNVDYADYYDRTVDDEYYDDAIVDGLTYHYRISVVDEAGNEGPISQERFIVADYGAAEQETVASEQLSTRLQGKVNSELKEVERKVLDAESAILSLQTTKIPDEVQVIAFFDLIGEARDSKSQLTAYQNQLESLLDMDLDEGTLDQRVATIMKGVEAAYESCPISVSIDGSSEFTQLTQDSDVYAATNEVLEDLELSAEQRNEYEASMRRLNDGASVVFKLINAEVSYLGSDVPDQYSMVEKTVISDSPNGFVVEIVPKSVAESASEIKSSIKPIVLKDDPVLRWNPSGLEYYELSYYFEEYKDLNELKQTRTIVLETPTFEIENPEPLNSTITGMGVNESKGGGLDFDLNFWFTIMGVIVVAGLAGYYFFFMKSEERYEAVASGEVPVEFGRHKVKTRVPGRAKSHRIIPEHKSIGIQDVLGLLDRAHEFADRLDMERAKAYYLNVLDIYNSLGANSRAGLSTNVFSLYYKLSLAGKIREAHAHVDSGDKGSLHKVVYELEGLLSNIGDSESPLVRHARRSKSYFHDTLKNMRNYDYSYNRNM